MDLKSGILLLMLAGTTTSAVSSPDAVAFVRATYAQYSDTMLGPKEEQTYSPELLAMIVADQKKAGGEGAFEADQLCQCQDWDGLRVLSLSLKLQGPNRVDADVVLRVSKDRPELTQVTLRLVLMPAGWRVDDVVPHGGKSMRRVLHDARY
jgi:hypothetical protein